MPRVAFIEKTIFTIEGFEVDITYNGQNVRSDASLPSNYIAGRMTKNSATVAEWKEKFKKQFPGYDAVVKKNDGSKARGQSSLSTVRDTYLDDID